MIGRWYEPLDCDRLGVLRDVDHALGEPQQKEGDPQRRSGRREDREQDRGTEQDAACDGGRSASDPVDDRSGRLHADEGAEPRQEKQAPQDAVIDPGSS